MNGIPKHQWLVYQEWYKQHCKFKPTAVALGKSREYVRQVVAKVETKLRQGLKPPVD